MTREHFDFMLGSLGMEHTLIIVVPLEGALEDPLTINIRRDQHLYLLSAYVFSPPGLIHAVTTENQDWRDEVWGWVVSKTIEAEGSLNRAYARLESGLY